MENQIEKTMEHEMEHSVSGQGSIGEWNDPVEYNEASQCWVALHRGLIVSRASILENDDIERFRVCCWQNETQENACQKTRRAMCSRRIANQDPRKSPQNLARLGRTLPEPEGKHDGCRLL